MGADWGWCVCADSIRDGDGGHGGSGSGGGAGGADFSWRNSESDFYCIWVFFSSRRANNEQFGATSVRWLLGMHTVDSIVFQPYNHNPLNSLLLCLSSAEKLIFTLNPSAARVCSSPSLSPSFFFFYLKLCRR